MITTTLWLLVSLTIWQGQEVYVEALNAYQNANECQIALKQPQEPAL